MNNSKICNPNTELPNTTQIHDKDVLNAMLSIEKDLIKNYVIAMSEASNTILHDHFFDLFNEIDTLQREIYDLMFRKGWYCLEASEETKISQKLNNQTQEMSQLEFEN